MEENKNIEVKKTMENGEGGSSENRADTESDVFKPEHRGSIRARDAWHAKTRGNGRKDSDPQNKQHMSYESYDSGSAYSGMKNAYYVNESSSDNGKYYAGKSVAKNGKSKKPFIIIGSIIGGLILLAILLNVIGFGERRGTVNYAEHISEEYIGVLYIEGTISSDDSTYSHDYALKTIDGMIKNDDNKALLLYVNTPGGGVTESDELYLKIKEYQETTGRPVYSYMASQATSGGYYISAPADRILANRNCWTGSIGVTMGTLVDVSGFLENHGIKTETITSGANKAMGSMTEPLTDEQRQILQSLIDEAYEQFVSIVAEGRGLSVEYVKGIADGRIYTAKQAKELKLVDDVVNTYDDAVEEMKSSEGGLSGCEVYEFRYEPDVGMLSSLLKSMDKLAQSSSNASDIAAVNELLEKVRNGNEMPLEYMCEVVR